MARTLVNGMMADEGWQAMTMLDWEEGRDYEIASGTRVHILRRDVRVAIESRQFFESRCLAAMFF